MTLAHLNRQKRIANNEEDGDSTASVISVHTEAGSSFYSEKEEEEAEEDEEVAQEEEEELQDPRDLEEVLIDEVVPLKLNNVWMGGRSPSLLTK